MIKIPCLFERDFSTRPPTLLRVAAPGCEWVVAGEGVAHRKRDGTACMVRDGVLYRRLDYKASRKAAPSTDDIPCQPERDAVTGHWPHWVPVGDGPNDRWHRDAFEGWGPAVPDGTYELCGPKVNGNHEWLTDHHLIPHDSEPTPGAPRDWDGLRAWLATPPAVEGVVFHHPDGRMCKIRRKDYGLAWPAP